MRSIGFQEILERKLFRDLGYSTINQYAREELKFSKSHTGEFLHLCRTFKKLPKVKQKVATGELAYASARVLARVANEKNQDGWLDFSANHSRRDLEKEVKLAKQEADDQAVGQATLIPMPAKSRPTAVVPVRVSLEFSPLQLARFEKLWELVRKQGNVSVDRIEALLEIMESYVAGQADAQRDQQNQEPADKAHQSEHQKSARADLWLVGQPKTQIHIHQYPDCKISRPNVWLKSSIPPSIRRRALENARYKCPRPGCNHTQFLEIHHIVPRSLGGSHDLCNLEALCSTCHKLVHENKLNPVGFQVKSPAADYHYRQGSCLGNATDRPLKGLPSPDLAHRFC